MALTDKLVAIADAIRGKTGGTEEMTLDQMVTAIGGIEVGGGGSGMLSGSFTPAENVLSIDIDASAAFTMMLIITNETVTGTGVKAAKGIIFDADSTEINLLSTNNSGSAYTIHSVILASTGAVAGNGNCIIKADGTVFSVSSTLTAGNCPGHFLAGTTYRWYAW